MKAYIQQLLNGVKMNRSLARTMQQGNLTSPQLFALQVDQLKQLNEALTPLFELGQKRGEIDTDMAPSLLAQMAIQTYYGVLITWCFNQGDDNLAIQMALSFDLFFKGVTKAR
jgi:hypothetical protein